MVTKPKDDRCIVVHAIDNSPLCIFLFPLHLTLSPSLDPFPYAPFPYLFSFYYLTLLYFFGNPCFLKIKCVLLLSRLYPSLLLFFSFHLPTFCYSLCSHNIAQSSRPLCCPCLSSPLVWLITFQSGLWHSPEVIFSYFLCIFSDCVWYP